MPTQNVAEEEFLNAMRDYVDFRFLKGVDEPPLRNAERLVNTFKAFVRSRPEAKDKVATVAFLVDKMGKLAESRGPGQPPPDPSADPSAEPSSDPGQ
jgi:hypothetical protein